MAPENSPAGRYDALIGLGSNMGDKAANIVRAIDLLTEDSAIKLTARSRDYRSDAWGKLDQEWFVNAAIAVQTELSARDLLKRCQQVENSMGRVRKEKWGERIIDADILTYRGETIDEAGLKIPHPLITERAFVLAPLADIAPDEKIKNKPVRDWLAAFGKNAGVELLAK